MAEKAKKKIKKTAKKKIPKSKKISTAIKKAKAKLKDNRPDCQDPNLGGRPREYEEPMNELVFQYALLGLAEKQMAGMLGVTEDTFNAWKVDFPQFSKSIKAGREDADAKVATRLWERAMGFEHDEERVFCSEGQIITHKTKKQYPPDVNAIRMWLMNRQPEKFRDRIEHTVKNEGEYVIDMSTKTREERVRLRELLKDLEGTDE